MALFQVQRKIPKKFIGNVLYLIHEFIIYGLVWISSWFMFGRKTEHDWSHSVENAIQLNYVYYWLVLHFLIDGIAPSAYCIALLIVVMLLPCILHCISLYIAFFCIVLHCIALLWIYRFSLIGIALHCIYCHMLHCIA